MHHCRVLAAAVTSAALGCGSWEPDGPQTPGEPGEGAPASPFATGGYIEAEVDYASSIDEDVWNLGARYAYDQGVAAHGLLPVLLVMHGYGGSTGEITQATLRRYASYGFLAVAVGKRARDGSGREVHDILDALAALRAALPAVADPEKASIVGYSGGGGNALALAHKAPDSFTVFTSFFGIADYGYDTIDGWWFTRKDVRSLLTVDIGDREEGAAPYRARDAVGSIARTLGSGGYLYMFHDAEDLDVTVANSRRVRDALDAAAVSAYEYFESGPSDAERWQHGYPDAIADNLLAEARFAGRALEASPWSMPTRGELRVAGWHQNKRFEIWLGPTAPPRTSRSGGIDQVADVEYDTLTATYRVTPLTGPMVVQVVQGSRDKMVEITEPTEIELNVVDPTLVRSDPP